MSFVPLDSFDTTINEIADNIKECYTRVQGKLMHFHDLHQKNLVLDDYSASESFMFDSCKKVNISLEKKFNHLLLRNSEDITINMVSNPISGIDLLTSKKIRVNMAQFDWINCEFVSDIDVYSSIGKNSVLTSHHCTEIFVNGQGLGNNVFQSLRFCNNVRSTVDIDKEIRIDLLAKTVII